MGISISFSEYETYEITDKGFALLEEYWSNVIDAASGMFKEFSLNQAKKRSLF